MPSTAIARRAEFRFDLCCVLCHMFFARHRAAAGGHHGAGGVVETVFRPVPLRPDASPDGELLYEQHRRERGEAAARAIVADTTIGVADGLVVDLAGAPALSIDGGPAPEGEQSVETLLAALLDPPRRPAP